MSLQLPAVTNFLPPACSSASCSHPQSHGTLIRKLSGGEKRRLFLLKLLMAKPNVLLLDEPTNDLDTETLTVLEDYISDFSGVVITVSHDRYFLDKTAEQLLTFQGSGHIGTYLGEYSEYLSLQSAAETEPKGKKTAEKPASKPASTEKKKRMNYNEKREWEGIDEKIASTEEKLEEAQAQLESVGSDFEKAQKLMEQIEEYNTTLENLIERWSYLSEIAED